MKNVKIFHGTGETPNSFWIPYVKNELERQGISVLVPQLPNTDDPILTNWLPVALEQQPFDEHTTIVSHSVGSQLVLSLLEKLDVQIEKAIFVAGYAHQLASETERNHMLQETYDWPKIKKTAREFYFVNAINDPWGCNDTEGRYLFDQLGGTLIINNEGHMGSDSFKQPYKEFPFLVKLIT